MARPHGTKYIKTPEELLKLWDDYKAQVESDEIEQATAKGEVVTLKVKRPLLRSGFESYVYRTLGISVHSYIDNDKGLYSDYSGVVTCMRKEWETDQVSGTMTGKYKAQSLTARLNGYTDKTETKVEGEISIKQITGMEIK